MDSPVLELKIVSASDLKKPGPFSSALQPYVVAAISGTGAASPAQKTSIDTAGGRNPSWNHSLALPLPGGGSISNSLSLRLQILSRRGLAADKLLGEVYVPLLELLRSSTPGKFISYQVKRPSGRSKGVLTFSYKFAGKAPVPSAADPAIAYSAATPGTSTAYPPHNFYPPPSPIHASAAAKPAMAYSSSTPGTSAVYPPQNVYSPPSPKPSAQPQAAYPPPPAAAPVASYGYPVQGGYGYGSYGYGHPGGQTGYGYGYQYNGPVVQPNKNKKSSALGLGAGLLGGALAGFLVGDLVSDGGFFC